MTVEHPELVPRYRYFTADVLSNEILQEISFYGVSYERGIKGAGEFTGKIPVIEDTDPLSLYDSTMPGKTALYVVKNDVCVWGGIIWDRTYSVADNVLTVSGNEFPSYFYHRKIWKTWSHQFGATIIVSSTGANAVIQDEMYSTAFQPGASIRLDFLDPADFKYNGYYKVADSPTPTLSTFSIEGAHASADIINVTVESNTVVVQTETKHGFNTGDTITVSGLGSPYDGTFTIEAIGGSETDVFSYPLVHADVAQFNVTGTAVRPLPIRTFEGVTVTVRADTYDFIRSLVTSVFEDFVGIDFPNAYIEPGLSYGMEISNKQISGGLATITTSLPHGLAEGQAVQIRDLDSVFDGEYMVTDIPDEYRFRFKLGGTLASTPVAPNVQTVTAGEASNYFATLTTSAAHGFSVGQQVSINCGFAVDTTGVAFNGEFTITEIPSTTKFKYAIPSNIVIPATTFSSSTATVGATTRVVNSRALKSNVATITTVDPHGFDVGDSVTIANVNQTVPLIEKSLDAPNSVATVTSAYNHQLSTGTSVVIAGLRDISPIVRVEATGTTPKTVKMTTDPAHNFKVGDSVTISDMLDIKKVTNKALTSNVATLTTSVNHNFTTGDTVTVSNLIDSYTVTNKALISGVATLTTSANHNVAVNDKITVTNITDTATVVSREMGNGVVTLTTSLPHNFAENDKITVSGIGTGWNGTFTILSVTDTRVKYEVKSKSTIAPVKSGGTITNTSGVFNGDYTVSAVTANTISYNLDLFDVPSVAVSGGTSPRVTAPSFFNGQYTIASTPSGTTFTYARVGNNVTSIAVPAAKEDGEEQSIASIPSIHLGARTITAVTRNTFSFTQTITNTVASVAQTGNASVTSIFNGTKTLTSVTDDTMKYTLTGLSNVLEQATTLTSTATATGIFNGTFTIVSVPDSRTFTYAKVYNDIDYASVVGEGSAVVTPTAVVSTFGPFPGNADIGIGFSTKQYSGVNITPKLYRSFELTNAGEALEAYSDSIDGFEYRIDCDFDPDTETFTRTFILIPIDFPDPPAPGEISPISRFGADKLVFEYPGNIINVTLDESAENSATRFFAIGENDLSADAGPPFAVAAAEDLLSGSDGITNYRKWPLLDEEEHINDIDDETVLYAYAQRYLSEARPPEAKLTVTVNGSLQPFVGTYAPGDWCSLAIKDRFIQMRLASDLEPRDDVIVRKIDSYRVQVPDGVTFPETVSLTLVPEWEVDKRGQQTI